MSYVKVGTCLFSLFAATALLWASESDELREKARAMQKESAELVRAGHVEEAEAIARKAAAMLEEAEQLEARHRDGDQHRNKEHHEAEIRELGQLLDKLRHTERELSEAGKQEAAADARHKAERIEMELHELTHKGEHDHGPREVAQRLEHMHVAAEHLHKAGLHEIAEHVVEHAAATERELAEHENRHRGQEVMHELMQQLKEMREEIGQLRKEVKELRERR